MEETNWVLEFGITKQVNSDMENQSKDRKFNDFIEQAKD